MAHKVIQCDACRLRGKTWPGDNPRCAFDAAGKFTKDNWNCATLNVLRTFALSRGLAHRRGDSGFASIPVLDESGTVIVLTWYKSRGCTTDAMIACDGFEPLHLSTAEYAIENNGIILEEMF